MSADQVKARIETTYGRERWHDYSKDGLSPVRTWPGLLVASRLVEAKELAVAEHLDEMEAAAGEVSSGTVLLRLVQEGLERSRCVNEKGRDRSWVEG